MSSEAFDQLCMSKTPTLPWIWVIEALDSSKDVDLAHLIKLLRSVPHISEEMGKDAREVGSLKILEGLASRYSLDNGSISDTSERIEFDPSDSCERVLGRIIQEARASNVKNGGLKRFKWDIQSFIAIKRASLPILSLQKLKDAILQGSHSVLESFKERSGLEVRTQCDENIPVNSGNINEAVHRLENRGKVDEAVGCIINSDYSFAEKYDVELQENVPDRNLLPTKRSRSDIRQTYKDLTTTDPCCGPGGEAAKKRKQDHNVPSPSSMDDVITSFQHDIPVKPSEIFMERTETEGCSLDKEAEIEEMEHVVSPDNVEDQEAPLGGPGNPVDEDITRNLSSQMQVQNDKVGEGLRDSEGYELRTSNGKSLAAVEASTGVDKAINSCKHDNHASRAAGEKDHIEPDQDPETASDIDEYHEETTDVNLMKNAFLSSQCTHSQDSLVTLLDRCMKCNNGGQLLVCSSNTCPIVVHESCLGSTAIFDGEGQFYCPFCAYYQALIEYMKVKKRTSLARKNMATFVGQQVVCRPKGSEGSSKSERNHLKRDENYYKGNVADNHKAFLSGIAQINDSSKVEDGQNTNLSVPCAGDRSPCREKVVDLTHEAPSISENIHLDGKNTGQECHSPSMQGILLVDGHPLKIPDGDVSSDKENGVGNENGRQNRMRVRKKIRTECALPVEAPCGSNIESSEGEGDKSATSKYTMRLRKAPKDHYYPAIPQLRRKKLPWTSAEEEKLKEGVQKCCSPNELTIPWKHILEFGADVFQKGRTPGDLKDKWRNICKGSPRKK